MSDDSMRALGPNHSVEAISHPMPVGLPARIVARLGARIRSFREDARGIAAVEFGLLAPIMVLFLLGTIEVTRAVAIDQRFGQVTNMIADLVARESEQLTKDDVNAIYALVGEVMRPYDISDLKLSIIPVMSDRNNAENTRVYPTTANRPSFNGGTVPAACQSYSLAKGMLLANQSVIVIEGSYKYKPMFADAILGSKVWTSKAFAKPRNGMFVKFDGNALSPCFS